MMPKTILALDVSKAATGWAFGPVGGKPIFGVERFGAVGCAEDEAWAAAFRWTAEKLNDLHPDVVALEAPLERLQADSEGHFQSNIKTIGLLWGLQAAIRLVVKLKMPGRAKLVQVSTARKAFTGRGTYPKGEAKAHIIRHCIALGWMTVETASEATADACCVFGWACTEIDRSLDLTTPLMARAA